MNRPTLIAGVGGGLLAVLLLAPAVGEALGALTRARADRAAVDMSGRTAPGVPPMVRSALRVPATSEAEAARAMAARIRSLAAAGGVLVEQADAAGGGAGVARLRLRLSGPDKAVVALADRLDREAPLLRLRQWQVSALAGGGLRLEGEAVAAWR